MTSSTIRTLNDIRSTFLNHFQANGHTVVDSAPLVPRNDPTLMFTVAGMVPFKNVFTGAETRSYTRAASSQKCVRAGGKHNDLENVGYTARHHTFFEMLGNFSFGDYFKEEAITLAWDLVSRQFQLPKDKLLVTVYHTDDEAADLWKKIAGFSDDRIIRIPTDDNFWRAGPTGPCGPCTELFIDRGDTFQGGPPGSPDEDGDRFLEFWNLVFMQYEQVDEATRRPLPRPSIDTGMGLERITSILQDAPSNYAIDLFVGIVDLTAQLTGVAPNDGNRPSFNVIADHLRAMSFLIADGVLPSNEGRGYVLRRIMRRAMRHAHLLGATQPILCRLVPALTAAMGGAYPELNRAESMIVATVRLEEERFAVTLDRGLKLLGEETARINGDAALPGEVAFKLYDTYGFPLDLTQDILRGQHRAVDTAGFERAMDEQRARARASWKGSGQSKTDQVWFDLAEAYGATDFLGYATETAEGKVLALVQDGARVERVTDGAVSIITNQTPFYGESGGQVGDRGTMAGAQGTLDVTDVQKPLGKLFVHHGTISAGEIKVGDTVKLAVDHQTRARIRANHSATHLLHEALRRILGTHVAQKGSLVAPDRLRFDISQPVAITRAQLDAAEAIVNDRVLQDTEVTTRLMTPDAAIAEGAMALFGEKYGDEVRVVSMGGRDAEAVKDYSVELCGGTHVARTGEIGLFKIVAEGAVGAGLRRVEAVTGLGAKAWADRQAQIVREAAATLKVPEGEVSARLTQLVEERRVLERELTQLRRAAALAGLAGGGAGTAANTDAQEIDGVQYLSRHMGELPARELKPLADQLKQQLGSGIVALTATSDGKASLIVTVSADLTARIDAVTLVRAGLPALGGQGGGGKRDFAQGGGANAAGAADALTAVAEALAAELSAVARGDEVETA